MSDDEIRIAKKVVDGFFVKGRMAKTKQEANERLFVAHSLITSILMGNTDNDVMVTPVEAQLEDVEERLNNLRTAHVQDMHGTKKTAPKRERV